MIKTQATEIREIAYMFYNYLDSATFGKELDPAIAAAAILRVYNCDGDEVLRGTIRIGELGEDAKLYNFTCPKSLHNVESFAVIGSNQCPIAWVFVDDDGDTMAYTFDCLINGTDDDGVDRGETN